MGLRAVAFDYGMVLSLPQEARAKSELMRRTGLGAEAFEALYWRDRHEYDRGVMTGAMFWEVLARDAGVRLTAAEVAELNDWDARMWTTENVAMVAWHRALKERGLATAILSNMGDRVRWEIEARFAWVKEFDVCVWSYEHGMVKPEAAMYALLLERLGTAGEETLFVDDRLENVEAARHAGMMALQFSTVEALREDLITLGLDESLPLP